MLHRLAVQFLELFSLLKLKELRRRKIKRLILSLTQLLELMHLRKLLRK